MHIRWISCSVLLCPALNYFHLRFVLRNHVGGENAAPVAAGVNDRAAADDAAGVQDAVTADFRQIAEQGAEFAEAGIERFSVEFDFYVAGQRFEIREHHARADMRFVAEYGIAQVIKMRRGGVVEQERVFQLG
jgi:hypothetical protein